MNWLTKSIKEIHEGLKSGEVTSKQLVEASCEAIEKNDPKIKSFLRTFKDDALKEAEAVDGLFKKGEEMPLLAGIPIAIKDNINIQNKKTTCSSKILENFVSPFDATAIQKLKDQKAIFIGKTNLDEFAMGSSTENSAFQTTTNPWDTDSVPGGSSGGSAAAVGAGFAPLSLGSDTGGSIRQPAAFCGVTGLKPTYGRVSRYGLVAFGSSLDQIGPFSRTVEDAAILLEAISGRDARDSTSAEVEVPKFSEGLTDGVNGLKIALPKELFGDEFDEEVKQSVLAAVDVLKAEGATVEEVSMPSFEAGIATYYVVAPAEASANLARFDGVRYTTRNKDAKNLRDMYNDTRGEGFGPEVKRRIVLGTFVLSSGYYDAYYLKAQKARTLIKQDFDKIYEKFDVVITPTTPTPAFKIGSKSEDPVAMYASDLATIPVNMAGLPGLSIPCGFSNGMPVGMQIIGKSFDEATILKVGHTYQQKTDHHMKQPGDL